MGNYQPGAIIPRYGVPAGSPGQYIGVYDGNSFAVAATLDQFKYSPLDLLHPITIDEMVAEVTTVGAAGAVIRAGIYRDDGSLCNPGALIVDAGTQPSDVGVGVKQFPLSPISLTPGRYWVGLVAQVAICSIRGTASTPSRVPFTTAVAFATQLMYIASNLISGALPDPASNTAGTSAGFNLALRIA